MAPSAEAVLQLIELLHEKSYPAAQRELQELKDFAKSKGVFMSVYGLYT